MVMGLLRAVADAIVIGTEPCAPTAGIYGPPRPFSRPSRATTCDCVRRSAPATPLNVVVSGSGDDLRPIFGGKVPVLICTSAAGAKRLARQRASPRPSRFADSRRAGAIPPRAILAAACEASGGRRILVEGGPRLLGDFHAAGLVDDQFLTLAPQIVGRDTGDHRLSLVMGKLFAPGSGVWGQLVDARRGSHLFLRYAFRRASSVRPPVRAQRRD
jgi:riboflavin biosynthesis pyrimidine reductase